MTCHHTLMAMALATMRYIMRIVAVCHSSTSCTLPASGMPALIPQKSQFMTEDANGFAQIPTMQQQRSLYCLRPTLVGTCQAQSADET